MAKFMQAKKSLRKVKSNPEEAYPQIGISRLTKIFVLMSISRQAETSNLVRVSAQVDISKQKVLYVAKTAYLQAYHILKLLLHVIKL